MEQAKKRDHKIIITDVAVDKVGKVDISDLSEEQCKNMQLKHKELLGISKNKNDSNEVLLIDDLYFILISNKTLDKSDSYNFISLRQMPLPYESMPAVIFLDK